MASRQTLSIILENKVSRKLKLSKNAFYKKLTPKLIFFNEKKIKKIPPIFDIENWLWKYDFDTFWWTIINWRNFLNCFPFFHKLIWRGLFQSSNWVSLLFFRIPSTIFGMPWHELKALHRENIEAESNKRSKKHRRKLLGKLSTDLDYLEGTFKISWNLCVILYGNGGCRIFKRG